MNVFLAIFVLFSASVSLASVEAATAVRQYDDGKTQVTSPKIDLKGTFLGDRASVGAGYTMDVVSSASSDVTSYGSKKISEKRNERERE
jgi:hypothetical protein